MAETDSPKPMTDGDIVPPPATTTFQPADGLKNHGDDFASDDAGSVSSASVSDEVSVSSAKQALKDNAATLRGQATDKAQGLVEDGKARAVGALQQLSTTLNDAAGQVDGKLGDQYGQYVRTAATKIDDLTAAFEAKSVEDLLEDARVLVRNSPGIAISTAAAIGFVVARVVGASVDQRGNA